MKRKRGMRKRFSLLDEYRNAGRYLKESTNFILLACIILILFFIIGFVFPFLFQDFFIPIIEDLIKQTENMGFSEMFLFILQNNTISSFMPILTGFFLGAMAIVSTIFNGLLLGFVVRISISAEGIQSLWMLAPHGIFEFPAVLISMGLGLKFGITFLKNTKEKFVSLLDFPFIAFASFILLAFLIFIPAYFLNLELAPFAYLSLIISVYFCSFMLCKEDKALFYKLSNESLRVFVLIVVPLLIIAALIESWLIVAL